MILRPRQRVVIEQPSGGSPIHSARFSRGSAHTQPTPKRARAPASTGAHCALKTLFPVYTIACPKPVVKCTLSYLCPPQTKRSVEYAPDTMLRHVKRLSAQPQTPTNLAPWPALAIAQPHKLPVSWRETPEHLPDDCGIRKHLTMLGDPPLLGGFMRPSGRCPALVCSAYCRRWVLQAREKVAVEFSLDHPDSLAVHHGSHPPARSPTPNAELSFGTPLRADRAGEA